MKLLILDRDGVINYESRAYIKSPAEWLPLPGSLEAIAKFTAAGFTIVIATNQSGVGRNYFSAQTLEQIHAKLHNAVKAVGGDIYKIYFCPHLPSDDCNCRKPKPGMFAQIAHDLQIDFATVTPIFVGDSLRDMELGLATHCHTFLVTGEGGDGQETLQKLSQQQKKQINIVENLAAVATRLLA